MKPARPMPASSNPALLTRAIDLHQQGQLGQAEALYHAILQIEPRNADALHLLGVLAAQSGAHQLAADRIAQAIAIHPNDVAFYMNRSLALQALGQWEQVVDCLDHAIGVQPDHASAHYTRGVALQELGRPADAIASYDHALRLQPQYAQAWANRGIALKEVQQVDAAIESYTHAVQCNPQDAQSYYNRAIAFQERGQRAAAVASYDLAIGLAPGFAPAHFNRGLALMEQSQWEACIAAFDQTIALAPDFCDAYSNRGIALQALGSLQAAVDSYDQAIGIHPLSAQAYNNRGVALKDLKRTAMAVTSFEMAIAIHPGFYEAHNNQGNALRELHQTQAAIASYSAAIRLKPDFAQAYSNRGIAYKELQQLDAALTNYDQAIALEPDYADAYWNKGIALLLDGDFARGWPLYEWRHKALESTHPQRQFDQPLWLGQGSLQGKTLLLHSEQGLGDTLQFIRYAPLLAAQGARVVVELPRALMVLLADMQGVSQFIEQGQALPAYDYHCPLLSLPLAFGTTLDNIPAPAAYVRSLPSKRAQWAATLGAKAGLRIGIAWSGSTGHKNDHNRSITLAELLQHLPTGPQYISLQKELREVDQATLQANPQLRHFGPDLADFTDTAALCDLMDLVISVDTSVAHLSAALGQTTWVLLPYSPDWRWLLERSDSPWYPSARLYRQDRSMRWAGVLQRLRDDVLKLG